MLHPVYKDKTGCHGNVPQLQGIGNIRILLADHSNPVHNQPIAQSLQFTQSQLQQFQSQNWLPWQRPLDITSTMFLSDSLTPKTNPQNQTACCQLSHNENYSPSKAKNWLPWQRPSAPVDPNLTRFFGPIRAHNPNSISIGSAVFAQMTVEYPYTLQSNTPFPQKIAPFHGGSGSLSNTWFPGPTKVLNPNSISIGAVQPFLQGSLL